MTDNQSFATIDAYIQSFPDGTRAVLENVRQAIRRAAPDAVETMSYGMPTFGRNGKRLVFLCGWKRHISLYPVPAGDSAFQQDIAPYKKAKSTLQFPLDRPIPYDLVERTITFLRQESR
jgi:uncharacterized protein YdhG (YjbR/CyaY superfamily)